MVHSETVGGAPIIPKVHYLHNVALKEIAIICPSVLLGAVLQIRLSACEHPPGLQTCLHQCSTAGQ